MSRPVPSVPLLGHHAQSDQRERVGRISAKGFIEGSLSLVEAMLCFQGQADQRVGIRKLGMSHG